MKSLLVIGGGAAGFFGAIQAARRGLAVTILEKSPHVLAKVRISGGGRCNVTHACFDPDELAGYYPRGHRELRGPFHRFQPGDTVGWFAAEGVELKIEDDGRMFPVTDQSETIVNCLVGAAESAGVKILLRSGVARLDPPAGPGTRWKAWLSDGREMESDAVLVAGGSSQQLWAVLAAIGHTVVQPVPSLFTFHCEDARIAGLAGLSVPLARVSLDGLPHEAEGPVLITHWGFSGPGILKLSAWGARDLAKCHYQFGITVQWDASTDRDRLLMHLQSLRQSEARKQVRSFSPVQMPLRLWNALMLPVVPPDSRWGDLSNARLQAMADAVCGSSFRITGKSTFKEEFVTAGGVDLREVRFTTMESRRHAGLYFAGEVLDVDAVTGGFNFQAAWTTSWIAANAAADAPGPAPAHAV